MSAANNRQKIKYFRKSGTSIDMSFNPQSSKFNSYHEWRKASNYNKEQNSRFVDLISSNSKLFKYEQCVEKLNRCLQANIAPNHLLISILHLSCHHFSPHAMDLIKHLLTNYSATIDLYITSISSPQFMIPHIAAMNADISLLQIYYNLNGDINVMDGRGVLAITVALAERHLKFCESLFWMNSSIPIQQLSYLYDRPHDDVAPFIAAFINFINVIEESKKYIYNELDIPNELIDILIGYTLPIKAYNGVKELLNTFKANKSNEEWHQIEAIGMKKLNEDKDSEHIKSIGVDYENGLESLNKMVTNIYVKPTRNKHGVIMLPLQESSGVVKNVFKAAVICSVIIASVAIFGRNYRK